MWEKGADEEAASGRYPSEPKATLVQVQSLFLFLAQQPPSGKDLLIHKGFYTTHNDASQSVGLLWTSDQPVADTST